MQLPVQQPFGHKECSRIGG